MARPLVLTLKSTPEYDVDMSPVNTEKLSGKTQEQIKSIRLSSGNKKYRLDSLFKVTGKNADHIQILNSHSKLSHIGHAMSTGLIEVTGKAGNNIGTKMKGGQLNVKGTVGDYLGSSMKGGQIEIKGNAGHFVAAGKAGETHGMSGGMIIITGSAGDRVGDRMRRGTIFIGKNTGDYTGSRMIAGTIIVMGQSGLYSGYAMKRGTIILTTEPERLAATFEDCGKLELGYLRLLFKQFAQMGQPLSRLNQYSPTAIRYAGDLANKGLGEILLLQ